MYSSVAVCSQQFKPQPNVPGCNITRTRVRSKVQSVGRISYYILLNPEAVVPPIMNPSLGGT